MSLRILNRLLLVASAILVYQPASAALPGDDCSTLQRWGWRGAPRAMASLGDRIYSADGRGLAAYDATTPTAIRQVQTIATDQASLDIARVGERLALLTRNQLLLFAPGSSDVERVDTEQLVASRLSATDGLLLSGGSELTLWSVNGNDLRQLARIPFPLGAEGVLVTPTLAFAAEHGGVVRVYDITGRTFVPLAIITVAGREMLLRGSTLYVAGPFGLSTVDVSNPRTPRIVDTRIADANLDAMATDGDRLFVSDRHRELIVFRIGENGSLTEEQRAADSIDALLVSGTRLYVGGSRRDRSALNETGSPLRVYDTQPQLRFSGEFLDYSGGVTGVDTDGRYVFLADPPLMRVIDTAGELPVEIASVDYGDGSDRLRHFGPWVFVYGRAYVHMIDVSTVTRPRYRGVYFTDGWIPNHVAFLGPQLIESNYASGLHVVDISDPAHPVQISGLRNDGNGRWQQVVATDNVMYGVVDDGVKIVDLTDPNVSRYARIIILASAQDVEVTTVGSRKLLLVADDRLLRVYDIADRLDPVEIGQLELVKGNDLAVDGSDVYLLASGRGIYRIDLTTPESPRLVGTEEGLFRDATQLAVRNGLLAIADRYSLALLRSSGPLSTPSITVTPNNAGTLARLLWSGGAHRYELQSSDSADFSTISETASVLAESADVPLNGKYWRVRTINSCGSSAWSAAVHAATPQTILAFASTGSRILITDATRDVTVMVPVVNQHASSIPFVLEGSGGVTVPSVNTAAPGAVTSVAVRVNPLIAGSGPAVVTLTGSAQRFVIELDRVDLTVRPASNAPALLIPGVGSTAGAAGTRWRSMFHLLCRTTAPCQASIAYAEQGSQSETAVSLRLNGGELLEIDDVVANVFGRSDSAGSIRITGPDLESLQASAYTYNDSSLGRFGQRINGRRVVNESSNQRSVLLGITNDAASRTNVGFYNHAPDPAAVHLELRGSDGSPLATRDVIISPFAAQPLFISDLGADVTSGMLIIDAPRHVNAWSSNVDRSTGDASFSHAVRFTAGSQEGRARLYVFDAAGSVAGAEQSEWRTALQIAAATDTTIRLTYVPTADPTRTFTIERNLSAATSLVSSDAMATLFPDVPPALRASGAVRVTANQPLAGWGRLYNRSVRGTFGQYLPLREATLTVTGELNGTEINQRVAPALQDRRSALPGVGSSDEIRTNLGLVETSGKAAAVRISTLTAEGQLIDFEERYVRPYESLFLLDYLASRGLRGLATATIEVRIIGGEGRVESYASVVQARTNDAVTVFAANE